MKKSLLLIGTLGLIFMHAQDNSALSREFQRQNEENTKKFERYISKKYGNNRSSEINEQIEKERATLAGFDPSGNPFFLSSVDLDQIKNSNSDFIQNGTITGLTGSFNGENIKYTVFDGGRAFGAHILFDNLPNRITNKEASSMAYSGHATAVSSFIGSKNFAYTFQLQGGGTHPVNFKGIAPNSTFDNYAFATTTLPGESSPKTVFQKIITAQPKISNHSYGNNSGWSEAAYDSTTGAVTAYKWNGLYDSGTSMDLQGTYFTNDENYDNIVYTNPSYIIVKSSGNYFNMGPSSTSTATKYYNNPTTGALTQFPANATLPPINCTGGFDCIGPGSLAKNIIVVGATDIITANGGRYVNSSDVVHSDYSSAGPRDDGGIKPDISAVGTNVASATTAEDTTGSQSVTVGSGTSYSAPIVTGIIGLWTQIYKSLFNNTEMNAGSAKALMIHTASEAGNIGPDPHFGWGFIDAKKGAELLVGKSNNTVIFKDEVKNNATTNTISVKATGNQPLKVTITWIDPEYKVPTNLTWNDAHNNRSSRLVNDLDLRVTDVTTNTVSFPWKLNAASPMTPATKGDNIVDNVEQVVIDNPVAGRTYKIEVTNKGTLVNNASTPQPAPQNYSIIVTGYSELLGTVDVNADKGIIVSPTLTKDYVKVLKAPAKSQFKIIDLSGKLLNSGEIKGNEHSLDLSSYTNGIYIIEINTGKEKISKKVIKE